MNNIIELRCYMPAFRGDSRTFHIVLCFSIYSFDSSLNIRNSYHISLWEESRVRLRALCAPSAFDVV